MASCSFIKHRLILIILGKQSILDDTTACQSWLVFTRHSLVRAKGEVLVLLFFVRFLSTISGQPAGRFTPNFACGRTLVPDVFSLLLGVAAPGAGAEKGEMGFS